MHVWYNDVNLWQEELEKERQALHDAGGDLDAWQSDSDEEEFFRREAELAEQQAPAHGAAAGVQQGGQEDPGVLFQGTCVSSFVENLSVE